MNENTSNQSFSLRKLEMAMPYLGATEQQDPKSLVSLAAIAMADESSLKLIAAGNIETLTIWQDKAYDLPSEEVAALLSNFIKGSARFKLRLDGYSPEDVNQIMTMQTEKLRLEKNLASPDELQP